MTLTTPETLHISVIIPTLNEEHNLESLLNSLRTYRGLEIIVADGGSTDRTREIARSNGIKVVTSAAGRGRQLNQGAAVASGTVLVFLHCDTRLPDDFPGLVHTVLDRPGIAAGAFGLHIDADEHAYRLVEWGANTRSRFLGLPYGDQTIFVIKKIFDQAGGFPDQPLLEDLELVRRLRRIGKIEIAPAYVSTSPRRWKRLGVFRTTLINQIILAGYLIGIRPEQLANLYRR